jgi:2'-aminobiphenyl-2,3-diol 1,2-dioxygenase, large subunit
MSVVGGFATAHIMMKRGSAGEAGERVFAGMKEIGRRIRALAPDLIVVVSSDHYYNYRIGHAPLFAVAAADMFTPFGDMQLPQDRFPGDAAYAHGLAEAAQAAGFPLSLLTDYRPDHGVVIPALIADPARRTPLLPVIIDTGGEAMPEPRDAWRLGTILRTLADTRRERVVVIGTGGLSHWLGVPEMGQVNEAFDRRVIDTLIAGRGQELAAWPAAQVRAEGGNGGLEIANWVMMAATLPGCAGEQVYYEPLPEWVTGMGGIEIFAGSGVQAA